MGVPINVATMEDETDHWLLEVGFPTAVRITEEHEGLCSTFSAPNLSRRMQIQGTTSTVELDVGGIGGIWHLIQLLDRAGRELARQSQRGGAHV